MPDIDPQWLILGVSAGSALLIFLAVGMAYRLGRDRGLRSRAARFDRLYLEVDFSGTQWTVCDTSSVAARVVGTMSLSQIGTRVIAEGSDLKNRNWSAEGVAFRRGVHLLFVERRERGHAVGSIHLQLDESGRVMTGMKSTWEGRQAGGAIETVVWHKRPAGAPLPIEGAVDSGQHSTATEANGQHTDRMSRPVDRLVREVVEPT